MSRETLKWLNTKVLIGGFTAWHDDPAYRALHNLEDNHYPDSIPAADIKRRLFDPLKVWEGDVTATALTDEGVVSVTDPDRKSIITQFGDEPARIAGLFKSGYQPHGYAEWLVEQSERLTGGGLSYISAGLLKGGSVAWVQSKLDQDAITTPEGVIFYAFLLAATSLDGSLSSTTLVGAQVAQCDNTLSIALGDRDARKHKVKHSSKSLTRVTEVRDALGLVFKVQEDFAAQVKELCETEVSVKQWEAFLDTQAPVLNADGTPRTGRGLTIAEAKREALKRLWNNDNRVSPWKGTAFGVVQAINTWTHWEQTGVSGERAERNALLKVTGGWDKVDGDAFEALTKVLATV